MSQPVGGEPERLFRQGEEPPESPSRRWRCVPFDQLGTAELYRILQLRQAVFVVEQDCAYQDLDGIDPASWHLGCWEGPELLAYTRLVPPGVSYPEPSIGRVLTAARVRRSGLGRELMQRSLDEAERLFGRVALQIGAQKYLRGFYEGFGFEVVGPEYLEDGIPHLHMVRAVRGQ